MKIRSTFHVSVLLMAVLTFRLPVVTFAQQNSVDTEARAAAEQDANSDVNKLLWFGTGAGLAAIGNAAAAPSLHPRMLAMFTAADVQKWLSQAQHLNLTDITSQRGIRFLEQLLAALIPNETALLPNYPNPFNPETEYWNERGWGLSDFVLDPLVRYEVRLSYHGQRNIVFKRTEERTD